MQEIARERVMPFFFLLTIQDTAESSRRCPVIDSVRTFLRRLTLKLKLT